MKMLPRSISAAASLLFIASVISGCSSTASVISGLQSDADYSDAYEVILSDNLTDISAVGASFEKGILTITAGGDYLLSGTLSDGFICIDAPETDKVKLILNGVSVTSSEGPALMARSADKVVIELAEGSSSIFTDGSEYSLSEEDASADSCIYSECDLKIKGVGSLSVNGSSGHGIHSKDDITIEEGSLTVNSAKDGIKRKDSVEITGGNITVISAGDGINSDNTDEGKGHISISGGNGALDYNGVFEVTGGTVITAGSSGMADTPSAQSAEYTLAVLFTSEIEGGTMISLQNTEGETIAKYSPSKKFGCITVTSPQLEANSTITVLKNGEVLCSTVLGSNITRINEKGEAVSSVFSAPGKGGRDHFGGGAFPKREEAPDMNGEPPAMPQGTDMTDMPPFDGVAPPAPDMNSGTVTGNAQGA